MFVDTLANLAGNSLALLLILAVGAAAMIYGASGSREHKRVDRGQRRRWDSALRSVQPGSLLRKTDPAMQLKAVMLSDYRAKPVISWTEAKVMQAAEAAVSDLRLGWRVLAQVSLGEVLRCESIDGFNAINAKRVDLLLIDRKMMPLAAIEYQGSGHHLDGTAAARDAVKKEALRKAGIGFIEIGEGDHPADVRNAIARLAQSRALDAPRAEIGRHAAAR